MAIDKFSKTEFEETLTNIFAGFQHEGLISGEETYTIPVNNHTRLSIRSSIDATGFAADAGQDSIRLWLEVHQPDRFKNRPDRFKIGENAWQPVSKKVDAYTTRVPGWETRLEAKIRTLWDRAVTFRQQPTVCECGNVPFTGFSQTENNPNRPYTVCGKKFGGCGKFTWLDAEIEKGAAVKFDEWDLEGGNEQIDHNSKILQEAEQEAESKSVKPPVNEKQAIDLKNLKKILKTSKNGRSPKIIPKTKKPNKSQKQIIEANINANIRLIAPPGSGKTFVIEHRYKFLIEQGIAPENILVVTYSKAMADEMLERILKTEPRAKADQISTIHALCFRILTRWDSNSEYFNWQVPKDWQVKKLIDELAEKYWLKKIEEEELPSHKEILYWLDNAKHGCLTLEDSKPYFVKFLGIRFGTYLHQIRADFDAKMNREKYLRFADMLYLVELKLKDIMFKNEWSYVFQYIIVDEAQDVNSQALKILIALSGS